MSDCIDYQRAQQELDGAYVTTNYGILRHLERVQETKILFSGASDPHGFGEDHVCDRIDCPCEDSPATVESEECNDDELFALQLGHMYQTWLEKDEKQDGPAAAKRQKISPSGKKMIRDSAAR